MGPGPFPRARYSEITSPSPSQGDTIRRPDPEDTALHAFNTLAGLPLSVGERAWLLRQLHLQAQRPAPEEPMARALVALGPVRTLKALASVRNFGRRRRAYLRFVLSRPSLEPSLSSLLHTLTATPPDVLPTSVPHPLGPLATFPPRVAQQLMLFHHDTPDAPERPGFPSRHPRIIGPRAALLLPTPPLRPLILGGGYVAVELGLHWASLGSTVTFIHEQRALLSAFVPTFAAPIREELAAWGATILINAEISGWNQHGDALVVYAETWEGRVAVVGDLILLAPG